MTEEDIFNTALRISTENQEVFPPEGDFSWTNQDGLLSLLQECEQDDDIMLVKDIIRQLNENIVDDVKTNSLLFKMSKMISEKEVSGNETAIAVMRQKGDTKSDGSQSIADMLKVPLKISSKFQYGYCTTSFNEIESLYKRRRNRFFHFIVVDDFIGSGKTVNSRYENFKTWNQGDATIHFYFLAGMAKAMSYCKHRGIPADCCKIMHKGISGHYSKTELLRRVWDMEQLENKLGETSGNIKIKDCSFGYNHAEALFCRKFGNIPNSVFPILWWNKTLTGSNRIPIFTRVQDGY